MKIPFSIELRPQIESGEYKVVTRDDRPARIICWDRFATKRSDNCNIVALVTGTTYESTYYYYQDGHLWNKANGEGDSPLDLFIVIPETELAESEDERIRSVILKLVLGMRDEIFTTADKLVTKPKVLAWLKKKKEQKPAEWSEWEYGRLFDIEHYLEGTLQLSPDRKIACIDFLKSFHPVKQEWSEEDEKTFWGLTAYIPNEELERLGVTRDDILKKLKSIRPQPIQLKEAYKDGFQTARDAIALAFMNYLDENRPDGKMCLSNGECEEIKKAFFVGDWAKIMRYYEKYRSSWKPSKEQMTALESAVKLYKNTHFEINHEKIVSLYEQLKKMM